MYASVTLGAVTLAAAPDDSGAGRQPGPAAVEPLGLAAGGFSDEAAMMLAGTVLIGLAAAVRRAA